MEKQTKWVAMKVTESDKKIIDKMVNMERCRLGYEVKRREVYMQAFKYFLKQLNEGL